MTKVALVTASTSSLPQSIIQRYNIHLIPFVIQFLDGNYREGEDISLIDFYRRLASAEAVPTTAPTSVAQFIHAFAHDFPDADVIMMFHPSHKTSNSYRNAVQAAERVPQRRIINIDTDDFSIGSGLLIIEAAQALEAGRSVEETTALVEQLRTQLFSASAPASVKYLRMSGRLGRLPAMAASLLGVIPVLGKGENGMDVLARPRSFEASQATILDLARTFVGNHSVRSIGINHTNAVDQAEALRQQVSALFPNAPVYVGDAGPILAVHVGPGALGLSLLREE